MLKNNSLPFDKGGLEQIFFYFNTNNKPDNKLSKKTSHLKCSVIETSDTTITTPKKLVTLEGKPIGAGCYGKVKFGRDIETDQPLAIKIQLANSETRNQQAFAREALILNKLGRLHSTTIRTYKKPSGLNWLFVRLGLFNKPQGWKNKLDPRDDTIYDSKFYIATKFYKGITLANYFINNISTNNTLMIPFEKILNILVKVFEESNKIHKFNVIHGDLSFGNILIDDNDESLNIHITDFGLSSETSGEETCKIYPISYTTEQNTYTAPECDYKIAKELIDKLESFFYFNNDLEQILSWNKSCYGFYTKGSDVYSLGWCINYYINTFLIETKTNKDFLKQLYEGMCNKYCFNRPSLENLINACKEQLCSMAPQKQIPPRKSSLPIDIIIPNKSPAF